MIKTRISLCSLLMVLLLAATACKETNDPEPDKDKELITTVTLRLQPEDVAKGPSVAATWRDIDGPGGQDPDIETLVLRPNVAYVGTLIFLDESEAGQTHDITAEITEEADKHEVFYVVSPANLLTIQKTDRDANNRPIGIETTISTGENTGTGTLRIVLKHQPGLKGANSNINTGETDVEVIFPTIVQN